MPQIDITPDTILNLDILDLNSDGGAIAKHNSTIVFLDSGLPGANVRAKITEVHKKFIRATVLETVKASSHEVEPFCKHFSNCGGCSWQNLDYAEQLKWKRERVKQTLQRIGKTPTTTIESEVNGHTVFIPEVIPSPSIKEFRNKMEYAFANSENDENGTIIGLRKRQSHEVIDLDRCPLQSERTEAIFNVVKEWAKKHGIVAYEQSKQGDKAVKKQSNPNGELRFLVLRETSGDGEGSSPLFMIEIISGSSSPNKDQARELYDDLLKVSVVSLSVSKRKSHIPIAQGEKNLYHFGKTTLSEKIDNMEINFPVEAFLQTNTEAASLLFQQVKKQATSGSKGNLWDLYCGVGAFSLYLANEFQSVIGVEIQEKAIRAANDNRDRLSLSNCQFVCADAELAIQKLGNSPDVLLVDPPRTGMTQKSVAAILKKKPKRIIYVSCEPATMSRDISLLSEAYKVVEVAIIDMFPHTPHMESIVSLEQLEA